MKATYAMQTETRLKNVLKKWGYEVQGGILISKGIRGYTSDRNMWNVRDTRQAVELLIPIISDDEFMRDITLAGY